MESGGAVHDILATITLKSGKTLILRKPCRQDAFAQVVSLGRKRIAHNCELGISVRKDCWGQGIGSALMEPLMRFAKENHLVRTVSLGVRAGNDAAIRLYEKFGFVKVGSHKDYFNVNGTFYDEILMDLSVR